MHRIARCFVGITLISHGTLGFVTTTNNRLATRTQQQSTAHHSCRLAHKKTISASRGQQTQSFAVTVESSSSAASDATPITTTPYLETPAATTTTTQSLVPAFWDQVDEDVLRKVMNALILTIAFGSAIYAILNIDAGMTRGWTQSEIAMRIPLDTWSSYEVSLEEKPVVTKTIINVVIYLLGDWLSQTAFSKKNVLEFDALRTLRNGFIGLCFGPLVVYYYQFSDVILPLDGGMTNRIGKILMDQTLYLSVKCSMYIMAVGVLQGDSIGTAAQNVKDKIKGIVFTAWKFWPLVHCITYSVIPAQHRILWVNMVDLVWNAILATISQKDAPETEETNPALALEADLKLLENTLTEETIALASQTDDVSEENRVPVYHFASVADSSESTSDSNTPLP